MSAPPGIKPEPLTAKAFAPFGEVIETEGCDPISINEGTTKRFHELSQVDVGGAGRAIISVFRATRREMPIGIRMLECHPLGSQSFVPMSGREWLVVVAPPVCETSGAGSTGSDRQGETGFSGKESGQASGGGGGAGGPDFSRLRCFLARGNQGVTYGRGVWHHPLLVLESGDEFVVVDRGGPPGRVARRQSPVSSGTRKAWPRSRCEVAAIPAGHAYHNVGPCAPFPRPS